MYNSHSASVGQLAEHTSCVSWLRRLYVVMYTSLALRDWQTAFR